jgi:alcohol dehydrogenase
MRTVTLTKFGGVENLVDGEAGLPDIDREEILVQVRALGFNPVDCQIRQAGFEDLRAPVTLGFEVAGVVQRVGAGLHTRKPGDEVMAWLGGPGMAGGYAEYVRVPAAFAVPKPSSLTFAQAAAVPLAGLTALRSLCRAPVGAHESLLVAGGAGGVGSWTILLAEALGAGHIVTTAGSEASRRYLRETLGLRDDQIVDYQGLSRAELAEAARAANAGTAYRTAIDCVGGHMTTLCCDAIDFEGSVVSIVNAPKDNSHPAEEAAEEVLFSRSATFYFELVFAQAQYGSTRLYPAYAKQLERLAKLIVAGRARLPQITTVGTLSAQTVRDAHRQLESGHTRGKLVAIVD